MWEVQHLLDSAFPAAIGATTAGAFYYLANRIHHRSDEAADLMRSELEHKRMVEDARIAQELRVAALSMQAISEELKQQRLANTTSAVLKTTFDPKATLDRLKAYRKRDPHFERAIAQFVEAEATQTDPIEGIPFEGDVRPQGPVQRRFRGMLSA